MPENTISSENYLISGRPVGASEAIDAAEKMLQAAAAPLIVGLDQLDLQSQMAAWKLADVLHATIDGSLESTGRGQTLALQRCGKVTASFGEIRNRADCLVCWFCDPAGDYPQQWEQLLKRQVAGRKLIVIDEVDTRTSHQADTFIKLPRPSAVVFLSTLRAVLADVELDCDRLAQHGIDLPSVESLVQTMQSANYGGLLYGKSRQASDHDQESESLARLIRSMNDHTRFVISTLAVDDNHLGSEYVLTATTGFPFAVNLYRGSPRFHGQEYAGQRLLESESVDAVLAVDRGWMDPEPELAAGNPTLALLEESDFLQRVPLIQLMATPDARPLPQADVAVRVCCPGDVLRADGAMIRTPNTADESEVLPAEKWLSRLAERLLAGNDVAGEADD